MMGFMQRMKGQGNKRNIKKYLKGQLAENDFLAMIAEDYIQGESIFSKAMERAQEEMEDLGRRREAILKMPEEFKDFAIEQFNRRLAVARKSEAILTGSVARGLLSADSLALCRNAGLFSYGLQEMLIAYKKKDFFRSLQEPACAGLYLEAVRAAIGHIDRNEPYCREGRLLDEEGHPMFASLFDGLQLIDQNDISH